MFQALIYLAIVIVSVVVSQALAPKPKPPEPSTLDDFDAPTAEDGRPIPWVFGTAWINGPNVLWYGDLKVTAIKKKGGKK